MLYWHYVKGGPRPRRSTSYSGDKWEDVAERAGVGRCAERSRVGRRAERRAKSSGLHGAGAKSSLPFRLFLLLNVLPWLHSLVPGSLPLVRPPLPGAGHPRSPSAQGSSSRFARSVPGQGVGQLSISWTGGRLFTPSCHPVRPPQVFAPISPGPPI